MDDYYSIPVNSDLKSGLALMASDMDIFQSPAFCEELDNEQLLALDDPQSFYLAFPGSGVFGSCDETVSRASLAVTPQSDCSTQTTLSTSNNISPTSDISSFHDKPTSQEIEAMYHDTTQSIISGRQSRAASVTWPVANPVPTGLNGTLTPMRSMSHRPQSFSYQTPQIPQYDVRGTPPPPSSFFPSPSLQSQTSTSQSPYLSPNLHSSQIPQMASLPAQANFLQATLATNPSSYYAQPQSQPPPPQQLQQVQQQFQHAPNAAFQQQLQQQLQAQQQRLALSNQTNSFGFFTNQSHPQGVLPNSANNTTTTIAPSLSASTASNSSITTNGANNPSTLPNTTGNSSTGYQCFSHGCGGRHFSNWGNLVRHHRERQLRSKAGAKPTCPRCGKGFTRSSARDAHVAGLKCVLGRRRRGNTNNGSSGTNASAATSADPSNDQPQQNLDMDGQKGSGSGNGTNGANGPTGDDESYDDGDNDIESGSLGSGGEELDEVNEQEHEHEHERHQDLDIVQRQEGQGGNNNSNNNKFLTSTATPSTMQTQREHEIDALGLGLGLDFDLGATHAGQHVYLAPQQLQFQ